MFDFMKKDKKIITDPLKYCYKMEEIQNKIDSKEISFETARLELEKISPKNINIYDLSGKIIGLNSVENRWAEPSTIAIVVTKDSTIISVCIEGIKIENFNFEKDDISNIVGRKIFILEANRNKLIKIESGV